MLDRECFKVLKRLLKQGESGSYKVYDWDELSKMTSIKLDSLKQDISHLKNNGYIDVKYTDDNEICVSVLPRGRELREEQELAIYSHHSMMKVLLISGVFGGLMAFLGAFLAMLIIR